MASRTSVSLDLNPLASDIRLTVSTDLKLLHTDPEQQKRGAGSMLLKWGADEADRLGLPSYLEASEAGRPLYEKFGYETVDVLHVDFSKWGGPADGSCCLMLRPPKSG